MARDLLVAEPDPVQRQLIDMLLAEDDYAITWTSTGKETLDHLKTTTPDLVLLKLALPDVTGAEICEKMKRVSRLEHVPVVLVAEGEEGRPIAPSGRAVAEAVGADLLLAKPLGDKNLRTRLSDLLQQRPDPRMRGRLPNSAKGVEREHLDRIVEDLKAQGRLADVERENERLRARVAELEADIAQLRSQLATEAETRARRKKRRGGLFNWRASDD